MRLTKIVATKNRLLKFDNGSGKIPLVYISITHHPKMTRNTSEWSDKNLLCALAMINSQPNILFCAQQSATVQRAILRPFTMKFPSIVSCAIVYASDIYEINDSIMQISLEIWIECGQRCNKWKSRSCGGTSGSKVQEVAILIFQRECFSKILFYYNFKTIEIYGVNFKTAKD